MGEILFANNVALGALNRILGAVSEESLIRAVLQRLPKGTEGINEKAIRIGFSLVHQTKGVMMYV